MKLLPAINEVSGKYFTREIVTGSQLDFKKNYKLAFGSYVKAKNDQKVTNNTNPRTHECIALGPTVNMKGTYNIFCIDTKNVSNIRKVITMVS